MSDGYCTSDGTKLISGGGRTPPPITAPSKGAGGVITVFFNILALFACFVIFRQVDMRHYIEEVQYLFTGYFLLLGSVIVIRNAKGRFYLLTRITSIAVILFVVYDIKRRVEYYTTGPMSDDYIAYVLIRVVVLVLLLILLPFIMMKTRKEGQK